jgi:hypothetical protein
MIFDVKQLEHQGPGAQKKGEAGLLPASGERRDEVL